MVTLAANVSTIFEYFGLAQMIKQAIELEGQELNGNDEGSLFEDESTVRSLSHNNNNTLIN